jgi:hypothetical protein
MSLARFCNRIVIPLALGTAVFLGSSKHVKANVILPNLPPGSQYEIIFATSNQTAVSSGSLGFYNNFVTTSSGTLNSILPAGVTWHAVASTGASPNDARDNAPSSASIPIYNTHGIEVSAGNLYSGGSLLAPIQYDENGNSPPINLIWTGADSLGGSLNPLGTSTPEYGDSNATTTGWITGDPDGAFSNGVAWPLYALSSPITVVPEPATLSLLGTSLFALGVFARASRRLRTATK